MFTTRLRNALLPLFLLAAFTIFLLLSSCTDRGAGGGGKGTDSGVYIPNLPDSSALAKVDHYIPKTEIMQFRRAFNADSITRRDPELFVTESEGFNKTALLELLKDPKCVGIRIYYGLTAGSTRKKDLRLIIVGTDSQGKDLFITRPTNRAGTRLTQDEVGLEYGQCCHGQPTEN
ncbi:MAG TPA: hypothetical protein VL307_15325 [Chitinophagaceae bacterium]|jgi:hypothetical protein|nr:hypothetical protein [Chitinophagaceae bacterium]